ncbi:phosphoglycerate dehydrogenase [Megamonas funiformis]|jgi:D-3-phosphoglycerate dehydrogenase|uniref:phosphoglycerate dehydrogenase n=1 Tax=Megamonas funiformis TaxID=437897 RepID=UPI00267736DE|nr:phosphoglycerate dehydrogenase [Megamonas funiformis]MBD9295391.1 hydroxyacid dehydrogenase [Megamonas funiformis]MBD9297896.1 hydroxyacid dehydrogenase [Megamonas funiformis]
MSLKVVVGSRSRSRSKEAMEILEKNGYILELNPFDRTMTEDELIERIKGASALVAGSDKVTKRVLEAGSPTLKIVAKQGVGYNTIDIEAAKELGIAVTITPGANSKSVADLTMGLILNAARNISGMDRAIRNNEWYRYTGCELNNKIIGIVGMGHIGGEVAKRAYAFGMKILAYDIYPRQDFIEKYNVTYVSLEKLFKQSDVITLHAPAIKATENMINRDSLNLMKSTAILVNAARGELINEEDLYEALKNKKIGFAALDVYKNEPLKNSKLTELENIVFTAHAGAYTKSAIIGAGVIASEEIVRVLSGEEPKFNVIK